MGLIKHHINASKCNSAHLLKRTGKAQPFSHLLQSRAVMLHVKDMPLAYVNVQHPHEGCRGAGDPKWAKKQRDPSSFVCIQQQQESPWVLKSMETPGWQPTQKASSVEGEFGWIGPSTLIAERKNPRWQLEQEVVVRVTVGFLNIWGFFAVPVSASKVVIKSSILCCYTINLLSWVYILVWTYLLW